MFGEDTNKMTRKEERFGSFLFGKDGMFSEFSDQQRMDRLKQCATLEHALRDCQKNKLLPPPSKKEETLSKQSSWWFPWSTKKESSIQNTSTTSTDVNKDMSSTNTDRTTIDLLSVNINTKDIDDQRIEPSRMSRNDHVAMKINKFYDWNNDDTAKQSKKNCDMETHAVWACRAIALGCASELVTLKKCFKTKNNDDCQDAQRILSTCVNQEAKELDERIQQRRAK